VVIGIHLARRGHLRLRVVLQRNVPVVSIVRRIDGGIAR
jgi:hypothetical protein